MKNKLPFDDEQQLVQTTRGFASRHQVIPPTPRDTLAVLRQAAEQSGAPSPAWEGFFGFWRWTAGSAAALALLLAGWWWIPATEQTSRIASRSTGQVETVMSDLGLDLVDWDMEFDALLTEMDASILMLGGYDMDDQNGAPSSNIEDLVL